MIDIHCHALPAVDDGAKKLRDALDILGKAQKEGITDVILTPHYVRGTSYVTTNETKKQILEILKKGLKLRNIEMNLHLGNEIYISPLILDLLKAGEITPLADSRYLLIELPLTTEDKTARELFFKLITNGYIPIIAHPERYLYVQENPSFVDDFITLGCLFQGDYLSLLGKYGRPAKKALTRLLKAQKIHFLASDIHKTTDKYNLKKAAKKVVRLTDGKTAFELFEKNPQKILKNLPLDPRSK